MLIINEFQIIMIIIIIIIMIIIIIIIIHIFQFCRYLREAPGEHTYLWKKTGIFPGKNC